MQQNANGQPVPPVQNQQQTQNKNMRYCKYCGALVNKKLKYCPNCHHQLKHPALKVIGIILAVLIGLGIIGSIFGINDSENPNDNANTEKTEEVQEEKTVFGVNETANLNGVEYTVTNVERNGGFDYNTPEDGKEYVIVTVNITNNSDEKISYNPLDFKMVNAQGQEDDEAFVVNLPNELSSGDLTAGGNVTGTLCFEEPAGDTELQLNLYNNGLFDDEPTCSFKLF